ncbi:ATP-binding protein [Streptomyces sp. NPDC014006]|uniref:ATP-binding protein n=1 Tax=Streptomyces sp. NPDC014006 TaxID=3364870 RepID=UPI0036F8E744
MSTRVLPDTTHPSAVGGNPTPAGAGRPGACSDTTFARIGAAPPRGTRAAPARRAVLALPAEARWVPVARRIVTAALAHWHLPPPALAAAELVVGELAANAAEHGHRDMTIHLSLGAGTLRISVTDAGSPAGSRRPHDDDPDEHGRGLTIVEHLTSEVRVLQSPVGRRVSVLIPTALAH